MQPPPGLRRNAPCATLGRACAEHKRGQGVLHGVYGGGKPCRAPSDHAATDLASDGARVHAPARRWWLFCIVVARHAVPDPVVWLEVQPRFALPATTWPLRHDTRDAKASAPGALGPTSMGVSAK